MAWRPARTCCTAWLPVTAPSERTKSSSWSSRRSRSAPSRARVCSSCTEPRSRTTSCAEYVRRTERQRELAPHSSLSSAACSAAEPAPPRSAPRCPAPPCPLLLPLACCPPSRRPSLTGPPDVVPPLGDKSELACPRRAAGRQALERSAKFHLD